MPKLFRYLVLIVGVSLVALLGSGCGRQARANRHLRRADDYYTAHQYAKAEVEYMNVLRLSPQNVHSIERIGAIAFSQGRNLNAMRALTSANQLVPGNPDVQRMLANLYLAFGARKEARTNAALVLLKVPRDPEAPVLLAETAVGPREVASVRQSLDRLKADLGDTAPLAVAYGILESRAEDNKAAEAQFLHAKTLDPKLPSAHLALAMVYWGRNDLKAAEEEYRAAAELSPAASAARLRYAQFKISNKDVAGGKAYLAQITKEAPDYVPAWLKQADLAIGQRDYTNCTSLLKEVLSRDADNFEGLTLEGRVALETGQSTNALQHFQRMQASYDRAPEVHLHLAQAQLEIGDVSKASQELTRALSLNTNYLDASILLSRINLVKGLADTVISDMTPVVTQHPEIPEAYPLLAEAWRMKNQPDQALAVYKRMVQRFPKDPRIDLSMGMLLMQENKPEQARQTLTAALDLWPNAIPIIEQIINVDMMEKHFDTALALAKEQQQKQPTVADPDVLVAKVLMAQAGSVAQEEYMKLPPNSRTNTLISSLPRVQPILQQAEAPLLAALGKKPDYGAAQMMLAELYVKLGRQQQALDRLEPLAAKNNNPSALMQIALIHEQLKQYAPAAEAYERLLKIAPDNVPTLNNLASLYTEQLNQLDRAYALANKAYSLAQSNPAAADTFGWVLYKRKEYSRALPLLTAGASQLTTQPEVQFHLGMVHYMLGNEDAARVALQRALALPDEFPSKAEATQRLAVLALDLSPKTPAGIAALETKLKEDPSDPIVVSHLAAVYERDQVVDKAIKLYQDLLSQEPKNALILSKLARLYAQRPNDFAKALEMAKDAHSAAPEDAQISYLLGRLAYQSGDNKWAMNLFQEAARQLPDRPDVRFDLAWACYKAGQVADAESAMKEAAKGPDQAKAAEQFLALVAAAKDPAQAQATAARADQVLQSDPAYLPALMVSALARESRNDFSGARKFYEQALANAPLFTPAARNLAILYAQHFPTEERAYDLATQARTAFPGDPDLGKALGELAYRRGDASRAAQLLRESARTLSSDANLQFYLGMSYYKLKQPKESQDALQRALKLNLEADLATEANRVLSELSASRAGR